MASGRTISASFLTDKDKKIIELCDEISNLIKDFIHDDEKKNEFHEEWGKIHYSRDAGAGRGAGKLQRDALCTRGRTGKHPISNRNLRWHPLIVSASKVDYAKSVKKIIVEDDVLYFVIDDVDGNEVSVPSDKVYELPERYSASSEVWQEHVNELKNWNDTQWTQNSCVIPALESCDWNDAVESYATLGISIAVAKYGVDFDTLYAKVVKVLKKQKIDESIKIPSEKFPTNKDDIVLCPMSKVPINENLNKYRTEFRGNVWQPNWSNSKRDEGDDSSLQIMHVKPLIEEKQRHAADNVRYGFRWCNMAMTDHSLDETLDFMEDIVKAHGRI